MSEQTAKRGGAPAGTSPQKGRSPLNVLSARDVEQPPVPTSSEEPSNASQNRLNVEAVREQLDGKGGQAYWRSLEELAQTEDFQELMYREFPREAAEWDSSVSRRRFLQVAAAGLALTGLTGCTRQPEERIVPFVRGQEGLIPGKPLHYASAAVAGGYATGVLVESHEGRPIKVEGNTDHPWSLGATDLTTQASLLSLYDPDRSRHCQHLGKSVGWREVSGAVSSIARAQEAVGGGDVRFLSSAVSSPTLAAQLEELKRRLPDARWVQWEPAGRDAARLGLEQAYGQPLEASYDLSAADVVLALDADLLASGPGSVRYARQFTQRRRVHEGDGTMNRLYAVESTPTPTGTLADHRLALRSSDIGPFAAALAARLGVPGASAGASLEGDAQAWVEALAEDLEAHRGRSLVVAGDQTSPDLVAVAHALNHYLGNVGATVRYTEPVLLPSLEDSPDQLGALKTLVDDMKAGAVRVLFIIDSNPVFDAPSDFGFVEALANVETCVHLGAYFDETARYCHWHINQAHYLEGWSDARAVDGTVSIVQPVIEPLFDGRTVHELLGALLGQVGTAYQLVESHWRQQLGGEFKGAWKAILHSGVVPDSALPAVSVAPVASAISAAGRALASAAEAAGDLELSFRSDPSIGDGRWANNAWLQEVPDPVTKLTWDNALLISPITVERLGLAEEAGWSPFPDQLHGAQARAAQLLTATGRMVRLTVGDRSLELPLWVHPGQADGTVTVHLGYGREYGGTVAKGAGFDVYPLRTSDTQWLATQAKMELTGKRYDLASTQRNANIVLEADAAKDRHLVRTATLDAYSDNPQLIASMGHAEMQDISFYPGFTYEGNAWGMVIDLNACTGCNACVVACQAENNVPTVGKEQVIRGREMHWLRIDRYYEGTLENPRVHSQPIPCMQCEQAPCEVVCPVAATVHSEEGLNDMVYNRCVGTRYCSNNCPYKVRRFNFLRYSNYQDDALSKMQRNPDVSVRVRGVMEKCTYCVQRIKEARSEARVDPESPGREIRDGDVITACQQACPSDAIAFGDLNDAESRVAKWKATDLNYSLLEELGTRPRTTYLAKLRNPNPVLEPEESDHHGSH